MIRKILFTTLFASLALIATSTLGYCQEFDDPEGGDSGEPGENLTVIDLAVVALDNQVYEKCECNSSDTDAFAKCAGKIKKKALNAFKPAAKFNQEAISELKQNLSDEIAVLVQDCEDQADNGGGDDDQSDDEEEF